jgi:GNAT superfamily N-acetyltransferase
VESNTIVGTVQVVLAMPDNQPHRADVAKMQVHRRARRRGLGAALMRAAEAAAREAGKTLLVLDTVTGGDAERLYARLGWQRCGEIPGYALWPHGGLCSTTVYYRVLCGQPQTREGRIVVVEHAGDVQ